MSNSTAQTFELKNNKERVSLDFTEIITNSVKSYIQNKKAEFSFNIEDKHYTKKQDFFRLFDLYFQSELKKYQLDNIELIAKIDRQKSLNTDYSTNTVSWIGYIDEIDVNEEKFTAKLIDQSDKTTYEIAEFSMDDVSDEDKDLIELGAIFYWSIAREEDVNGQIKNTSLLRFKRSIPLEVKEFDAVTDEINELNCELLWD